MRASIKAMALFAITLVVLQSACTRKLSLQTEQSSSSTEAKATSSTAAPKNSERTASFVDIELGMTLESMKSKEYWKSCKPNIDIDEADKRAGVLFFDCEKMHRIVDKALLRFFEGKLFGMNFYISQNNELQEKVRGAFIEKFGKATKDISNHDLNTGVYPAEVFAIPTIYGGKGRYEKWESMNWKAYSASRYDMMFYVKFFDVSANEKLKAKYAEFDKEKSKSDLKDLGI